MSTDRLYYKDSYLFSFGATVLETDAGGKIAYLDRTAFYPTSGGQPHDLGTLNDARVLDVLDEGDRIAHVLDRAVFPGPARGEIDALRRYDHMQQHTGQHLLSAVFDTIPTLSFHMGEEVSTIELGEAELTAAKLDAAEKRANELVREARPVVVLEEDASTVEGLRKASQRTGALRIVEITDLDRSACGGTHVRSTAELGPIQIRKQDKIRGHVRIEFVCGERARRRARSDFQLLAELSRLSSAAAEDLPATMTGIRQRLAQAEKERQALALELAQRDGAALYQASTPDEAGLRRAVWRTDGAITEELRAKAIAFAAQGPGLALVMGSNPSAVLLAGRSAGTLLKAALQACGGRGGGSAALAQGSVPSAEAAERLAAELGFRA